MNSHNHYMIHESDHVKSLKTIIKTLENKIKIAEKYLKTLGDCDCCVHKDREHGLCDMKCEFEVRYE
jgi:hypothetical protein